MELRAHGQRAVLVRSETRSSPRQNVEYIEPADASLGDELTSALHEWARVAAAVQDGGIAADTNIAAMVSRRGRQLATRVAATLGTTVHYHDPIVDKSVPVRPTTGRRPPSAAESLIGTAHRETAAVPWLTGSTLALFIGVVVAVAILALTTELAAHVAPWLAIVAVLIVTAGLVPSLWLARRQPILRWGALGAATGIACSWLGTVVVVLQSLSQ